MPRFPNTWPMHFHYRQGSNALEFVIFATVRTGAHLCPSLYSTWHTYLWSQGKCQDKRTPVLQPRCLAGWHRFDRDSPWLVDGGRPGPSPFKREGSVFDVVHGASSPQRIYQDVVHTFHIGFGCDLAASMVVWLAKMNHFGNPGTFDGKLRSAFGNFQEWCSDTNHFSACDEWTYKRLSMNSILGLTLWILLVTQCGTCTCNSSQLTLHLRTNDYPISLAGKGHDTGVVCRWLQWELLQIVALQRL